MFHSGEINLHKKKENLISPQAYIGQAVHKYNEICEKLFHFGSLTNIQIDSKSATLQNLHYSVCP